VSPEHVRERESRWALPAALAAFAAVILMFLPGLVSSVSGSGEAEVLRSVNEHGSSVTLASILQAVSFLLLAIPLVYLFMAARARSERVLPVVLAIIIAGPLLIGIGTVLYSQAKQEGAESFVAGEAKPTISAEDLKDKCEGEKPPAACEKEKREDDAASNAISDASLTTPAGILTLGGGLLFAIALFYTCLWAMRTGLLSRFWGSLGMALGIAVLIGFIILAIAWFLYLGLLYLGFIPGGKPAAWEEGEAAPWPTPGERAAAELEPSEGVERAEEAPAPEAGAERRKRKQRE
jgi:hypothetical protein